MKKIELALKEAKVTMDELPKKTKVLIADYKKILWGIEQIQNNGKTVKPETIEKAESYQERIIEDIAQYADDKEDSSAEAKAKAEAEAKAKAEAEARQSQQNEEPVHRMNKAGTGLRFWEY